MRFLTSTRPLALLLVAFVAALALPTLASADGKDVLRDCAQDGDLDKDYSDEELEDAYSNMPSDIDEYSNCRDVIRQAQAGGRGSEDGEGADPNEGGGADAGADGGSDYRGSESGDDVAPEGGTPEDQQELANRADGARNGTEPPTAVDTASSGTEDDDSGMPTAALVAIILLAIAAIGGGLYAVRDRLPGSGPGQDR